MPFLSRFRRNEEPVPEGTDDAQRAQRPAAPGKPSSPEAQGSQSTGPGPSRLGVAKERELDEIIREIGQIRDAVGSRDSDEAAGAGRGPGQLRIKLKDALDALPVYCRADETDLSGMETAVVTVSVSDLYGQLARGKVVVPLADLITEIPSQLMAPDVQDYLDDEVTLPLQLVVASVSPDELQKRTTSKERDPGVYAMPDLFRPSQAKPAVESPVPAVPAPAAETAVGAREVPERAAETQVVAEAVIDRPAAAAVPAEPEAAAEEPRRVEPPAPLAEESASEAPAIESAETEAVAAAPAGGVSAPAAPLAALEVSADAPVVLVRGFDLNRADPKVLAKNLPGVGARIAARMVAHRPYRNVFDLCAVRGISAGMFEELTGVALPGGGVDPRAVEALVGATERGAPDLKGVAHRVSKLPGIAGCLLCHLDGYVLAGAWESEKEQTVGAFAPQVVKNVAKYVDQLGMGALSGITLFVASRPVTFIPCEDVVVVLLHHRSRYSKKRIDLVRAVAQELVRRLRSVSV